MFSILHLLQKGIHRDLVELPFYFMHNTLSNRKLWSGETTYNLNWIINELGVINELTKNVDWVAGQLHAVLGNTKEFIHQPLSMALQTHDMYKGKTLPCVINQNCTRDTLNTYSPLATPPHAPLTTECIFPSHFLIACLLKAKSDYLLFLITRAKQDLNSWQENCSMKVWSTWRSVLFNRIVMHLQTSCT